MSTLEQRRLKTEEEAGKFVHSYLLKLDLSYIPKKIKLRILNDASHYITMDILCEDVELDKVDILNKLDRHIGEQLFRYLEHKHGNNMNEVRRELI